MIGPTRPDPPTEWQPPQHTPPGPDVIGPQRPVPGTEAGNKIAQGKPVGAATPQRPVLSLSEAANNAEN